MSGPADLVLRPLRRDDEAAVRAAHRTMAAESFDFALGLDDTPTWDAYLTWTADVERGRALPPGYVPATFRLAVIGDQLVGRVSVRHELNDFLRHEGGHLGYGVLRAHRGRGFGTELARRGVLLAASLGIDPVLAICERTNSASAAILRRCGGRPEPPAEPGVAPRLLRFWIASDGLPPGPSA